MRFNFEFESHSAYFTLSIDACILNGFFAALLQDSPSGCVLECDFQKKV